MENPSPVPPIKLNAVGLSKKDYDGSPSTLCKGCGHNSIASQVVQVGFELNLRPHEIIKLSGIGCSSKSPAYFLGMSHGFNALHGRMPSVATGALLANHTLKAIGVSGDGDTGSIGMGQFKHLMRRNVRMVYVVENNGVYGLTKGQFSATAEEGLELKYAGHNEFPPVDLCMEAIIAGCGFVARSFAGDAKQVRELLKAALSHRGTALLDIISPCVAFNNEDDSPKSYSYGTKHEQPLHELGFIPHAEEISIEPLEPGEFRTVRLHDGSLISLRNLGHDYDPTNKLAALERLQRAQETGEFITGLIYYNPDRPSLAELEGLSTPLAQLSPEQLRPSQAALEQLLQSYR
ncbi:MAG: 2-oxoglutarate ferredoxin oxidoreductase subunit beta [Meiothermus sp.]|uniref:2-oxoacid:ferredoxin oxidoreductase subunit beta n=1 Tax=Meiothermus sp. TaxID=1955249 RepID=UPI0021DD9AA1|nr:2-oxoacid:ferredoxin oxidoreductase subunit beta [Meiothermus sp.]GIW28361.1 MAG: 2-oxoglutarate ferredoxin oxidoreductase subunit beta [Meiothermus sp.]